MDEGLAEANGLKLHDLDRGGGGRPLALLGGLGGTAHLFRGLAPGAEETLEAIFSFLASEVGPR